MVVLGMYYICMLYIYKIYNIGGIFLCIIILIHIQGQGIIYIYIYDSVCVPAPVSLLFSDAEVSIKLCSPIRSLRTYVGAPVAVHDDFKTKGSSRGDWNICLSMNMASQYSDW
jgi:hypothetical protein